MSRCNHQQLSDYLNDQLAEKDRLEFFYHLDQCDRCLEGVREARKAEHPEYYQKAKPKKVSSKYKESTPLKRKGAIRG